MSQMPGDTPRLRLLPFSEHRVRVFVDFDIKFISPMEVLMIVAGCMVGYLHIKI